MWESIKKAFSGVKETTGIDPSGLAGDLGSTAESATSAIPGLNDAAAAVVGGEASAETLTDEVKDVVRTDGKGGVEGAGDKIAATATESAGHAPPDLFEEFFGPSPLK